MNFFSSSTRFSFKCINFCIHYLTPPTSPSHTLADLFDRSVFQSVTYCLIHPDTQLFTFPLTDSRLCGQRASLIYILLADVLSLPPPTHHSCRVWILCAHQHNYAECSADKESFFQETWCVGKSQCCSVLRHSIWGHGHLPRLNKEGRDSADEMASRAFNYQFQTDGRLETISLHYSAQLLLACLPCWTEVGGPKRIHSLLLCSLFVVVSLPADSETTNILIYFPPCKYVYMCMLLCGRMKGEN